MCVVTSEGTCLADLALGVDESLHTYNAFGLIQTFELSPFFLLSEFIVWHTEYIESDLSPHLMVSPLSNCNLDHFIDYTREAKD